MFLSANELVTFLPGTEVSNVILSSLHALTNCGAWSEYANAILRFPANLLMLSTIFSASFSFMGKDWIIPVNLSLITSSSLSSQALRYEFLSRSAKSNVTRSPHFFSVRLNAPLYVLKCFIFARMQDWQNGFLYRCVSKWAIVLASAFNAPGLASLGSPSCTSTSIIPSSSPSSSATPPSSPSITSSAASSPSPPSPATAGTSATNPFWLMRLWISVASRSLWGSDPSPGIRYGMSSLECRSMRDPSLLIMNGCSPGGHMNVYPCFMHLIPTENTAGVWSRTNGFGSSLKLSTLQSVIVLVSVIPFAVINTILSSPS